MSTMYVNKVQELNVGSGVHIPGHIIQVVNGPGNTGRIQSSSTSYTDTPISATITPKYNTSKILVSWSTACLSPNDQYLYFRLMCAIGGGSQALVIQMKTTQW